MSKLKEKEKAVALRRGGLSYREILQRVPVAKSTLSLWLRSVGLSKRQKQRLTQKKLEAALRGAQKRREQRIETTRLIKGAAIKEVGQISLRELWLMGTMLYWAEGSKEKDERHDASVEFSNSDPFMIKLFLKWLREAVKIPDEDMQLAIYLHENHSHRLTAVRNYWSGVTQFTPSELATVYWKKNKIKTLRKNTGERYYGQLKISIRASSRFGRKIAGWTEGVCKNCGVV